MSESNGGTTRATGVKSLRSLQAVICPVLALALALAPLRAYSDTSPSPSPTPLGDLFSDPVPDVSPSPTPTPSPTATAAAAKAPSSSSPATPADNTTQRQAYQDAIDKGEEAKKGNEYSAAIWGVTTILCGYNCVQYFTALTAVQATLQAAYKAAYKDVATLNACPGGGNAAAAPYATALTNCGVILGTDTLSKVAGAAGLAGIAALPAVFIKDAAAEKSHLACQTALKSTMVSATGTAVSQAAAWHASVAGQAAGAACDTAATSIDADLAALVPAETAYWTASRSIITTNYFCAGAAVASAAADLAISKNMASDVGEGMMGAIGGASAVIGTVVALGVSSSAYDSHNASGITSCVTAVLGGIVTANKIVTAQDYQNSIDENTASRDSLARLDPSMLTPKMWLKFFASAGDTVGSLFGSCAYAAVRVGGSGAEAFKLAEACKQSSVSHATRLSCARTADPVIEKMAQVDPSHLPGLLENFQDTFGADALQQVLAKPFDPGLMASLMARGDPSRVPALTSFFASLPAKVTGKTLKPSAPGPVLGLSTLPPSGLSAGTSVASGALGSASNETAADRTPANIQAEVQEIAAGPTSIFDIVSKRYRLVQDRVKKEPYTLPYNRFSTTN